MVNFDAIRDAASIHTLCQSHLTPAAGAGRYDCPACNGNNITITPNGHGWQCWECSIDRDLGGDAVGLMAMVWRVSRVDSARRLSEIYGISTESNSYARPGAAQSPPMAPELPVVAPVAQPLPHDPAPWEVPSWKNWANSACARAHSLLMGQGNDEIRGAWQYLTGERGLAPETIGRAMLGFNPRWVNSHDALPGAKCSLAPGIVIPWFNGKAGLFGANVRQFHKPLKDKYLMMTGSRRAFPYTGGLARYAGDTAVITEGEFDTLIIGQEVPDVPVFTLGGSQCRPELLHPSVNLRRYRKWLLAIDADAAGDACRDAWYDYAPRRCHDVTFPKGKDATDAFMSGVDLAEWFQSVTAAQA